MNQFAFQRQWGPKPCYPGVVHYKVEKDFIVVAGPCSVEDGDQIRTIARVVSKSGATHLRGGVFRAGTYPGKNFGWIDEYLIKAYHDAAVDNGLKNIIEVLDYTDESLELVDKYADCFQIGARSMQNYTLLKKVASFGKQVFLKRGVGSTLDEWLGAAEYLIQGGCSPVLIERGSATNANHVRWDLSISMIPAIKAVTSIPVIVDGSHGTGRRDLVEPMTLAGVAAGSDGFLVEVHEFPNESFSDPEQAIDFNSFKRLINKVNRIKEVR
jgi:3-deoxy-7-phosphoheptulonate synthase